MTGLSYGPGRPVAHRYTPQLGGGGTWVRLPDMAYSRWYPTATTLPDGKVLVSGGEPELWPGTNDPGIDENRSLEIYDPASNTWTLMESGGESVSLSWFPFMFVLPDGNVFYAGSESASSVTWDGRVLDTTTNPFSWRTYSYDSSIPGGSAVMYKPGWVMKSGGGDNPTAVTEWINVSDEDYLSESRDFERIPGSAGDMSSPRHYHDLTILPDGRVLATGGNTRSDGEGDAMCVNDDPDTNVCWDVLTAEIWDPETKVWCDLVDDVGVPIELNVERMYHSTAMLHPDGRVLIAGGGKQSGLTDQMSGEFLTPPYLLTGGLRPNPTITTPYVPWVASGSDGGIQIGLSNWNTVAPNRVTLLRLGSVTHQNDMDQRFIELGFEDRDADGLWAYGISPQLDGHKSSAIAPPGWYMLFVLSDTGAPSIGKYVQVGGAAYSTWECRATGSLTATETSCAAQPVPSCPGASVRTNPVTLPSLGGGNSGWLVSTEPGAVKNPSSPTTAEINMIKGKCIQACQSEWSNNPAIGATCGVSGGFSAPVLKSGTVLDPALDLVPSTGQNGAGLFTGQTMSCQVGTTCCNQFDEEVCVSKPRRPSPGETPLGRVDEYEVALSTSSSNVAITTDLGTYTRTLSGQAGYSYCSTTAPCPFYLSDFDANACCRRSASA